jgi:hypothetical protein
MEDTIVGLDNEQRKPAPSSFREREQQIEVTGVGSRPRAGLKNGVSLKSTTPFHRTSRHRGRRLMAAPSRSGLRGRDPAINLRVKTPRALSRFRPPADDHPGRDQAGHRGAQAVLFRWTARLPRALEGVRVTTRRHKGPHRNERRAPRGRGALITGSTTTNQNLLKSTNRAGYHARTLTSSARSAEATAFPVREGLESRSSTWADAPRTRGCS